jgi:hypothetical protein
MVKKSRYAPRIHPDFYYGFALMIVGVGLLLHTFNDRYDFDLLFGDVSTVFFPRVILILWVGLSLILMVKGYLGSGSAEDRSRVFSAKIPKLTLVMAVIIVMAGVLWMLGTLVGGPILMIAVGLALGYRQLMILVPISLILPVLVWYALSVVAKISLPAGFLLS